MKNLYIEAMSFTGTCIVGDEKSKNPAPYGYGLEHVEDINTHVSYTIIMKGNKNYAYRERPDGSLVW